MKNTRYHWSWYWQVTVLRGPSIPGGIHEMRPNSVSGCRRTQSKASAIRVARKAIRRGSVVSLTRWRRYTGKSPNKGLWNVRTIWEMTRPLSPNEANF